MMIAYYLYVNSKYLLKALCMFIQMVYVLKEGCFTISTKKHITTHVYIYLCMCIYKYISTFIF